MTKTTKIIWRLKEQPTADNLKELVKEGLLTKEEARQILFSSEEVENRDNNSLKEEIKFLRELVEKISLNREQIVGYINVEKTNYDRFPWYIPYVTWSKGLHYSDNSTYNSTESFQSIITW